MIRKKVSDLPFLSKDNDLISDGDELYFCSTTCYMQFALMHRSPSLSEDKVSKLCFQITKSVLQLLNFLIVYIIFIILGCCNCESFMSER